MSTFLIHILLILGLTHSSVPIASKPGLDTVRDWFFSMKSAENGPLNLYFKLKPLDVSKDAVILAYRGAASAASAGSVSGVNRKLQYFSQGKEEIEEAVRMEPENAEIRFLRLVTQQNAPAFLGYRNDIETDKSVILRKLSAVPANDPNAYLYLRISDYLLQSGLLKSEEMKRVTLLKQKFAKMK